jgi:methyl-accepting chemotaxis protein
MLTTDEWVDHTHEVMASALKIQKFAVDMETGVRGYLLAGQEEFLEPFEKGQAVLSHELAFLKKKVGDNPKQVNKLEKAEETLLDWNNLVVKEAIQLRKAIGNSATMNDIAKIVAKAEGKLYFDKLREKIALFINNERDLFVIRQKQSEQAFQKTENISALREAVNWVNHTHEVIQQALRIQGAAVDTETGMRGYLLSGDEAFLAPYNSGKQSFFELSDELKKKVDDNPKQVALLANIEELYNDWLIQVTQPIIALREKIDFSKTMDDMASLIQQKKGKKYFDRFRRIVSDFYKEETALLNQRNQNNRRISENTQKIILFGTVIALAMSLLITWLLSRRMANTLGKMADQLNESALQVHAASEQVSSASQELSSSSSQQASALEETSSSLEEMSTMTKQNAANAEKAKSVVNESESIFENADGYMLQLTGSMEDINKSSEETYKITKTIDEIAFQTNLLALNAAVEAARAGDTGAGFAVVAEEVRNLALRASDAAKSTSGLIEDVVKKIKEGTEIVDQSNQAFKEIKSHSSKVQDLVAEIAAASSEQAQGIEQINNAVLEMDKLTQTNAANSEETSSAAEQLSGQSAHMKTMVVDLTKMVNGRVAVKKLENAKSRNDISEMRQIPLDPYRISRKKEIQRIRFAQFNK